MNWYKTATIHNFEDRNIVNDRIDELTAIGNVLSKMSKMVFQTGAGTQQMLHEVMSHRVLSSYPPIVKLLKDADSVCLDSPHKFAALTMIAMSELDKKISTLRKERHDHAFGKKDHKWKGWKE